MTIVSAPAAAGTDIDGSQYNSLRQDLLVNHVHDGGDGARIDHDDLADDGVRMGDNRYSHVELDQHVDATTGVHGLPVDTTIVGSLSGTGLFQHGTAAPGWTGSGWESHTVTFPTAFKGGTIPTVVITPLEGGTLSQVAFLIRNVTNVDFIIDMIGLNGDDKSSVNVNWLAIGEAP